MKRNVVTTSRLAVAALAWVALAGAPLPAAAQEQSIEGTWRVSVEVGGQPPAQAVESFFADGRVIESVDLASAGPALGEWVPAADGKVSVALQRFLHDAKGRLTGTLTSLLLVTLAGDGFSGEGTAEVRDVDGVLRSSAPVTLTASRLTADPAFAPSAAAPVVITGSGAGTSDIRDSVRAFKSLLGGKDNGGEPSSQPSGFRTINWDAVPEALSAPNTYPSDFFNGPAAPRARGAILTPASGSLMVSADADNSAGALPRFGNINATYADIFHVFSKEKLFSPVGSNVVDLTFQVPGSNVPAVTRGFGAVYTDVDTDHTAFEFFGIDDAPLGSFSTPIADNGLSFLGVAFPEPVVHRVRITYGTSPLGPDDGAGSDVSVMDDFIYGEPQAAQ